MKNIKSSIKDNEKELKDLLHCPLSNDVQIREFTICINKKIYDSLLVFYDGLVDIDLINNFILKQLMKEHNINSPQKSVIKNNDNINLLSIITNSILSEAQINIATDFDNVVANILRGDAALFIDTLDTAIICDVKKVPNRNVSKAENEMNIKGPSEAFIENFRTNTALIRKYVKDKNLIFENFEVGTETKTRCAICYISTITNENLINEVKRRVSSIKLDYLLDSRSIKSTDRR